MSAPTLTASAIKEAFMARAYFADFVIANEADYLFKPDIVTVSRNLTVSEYEIKVSRADLRRELEYIELAMEDHAAGEHVQPSLIDFKDDIGAYYEQLQKLTRSKRRDNKYIKHRLYLYNEARYSSDSSGSYRPNRFYFLIPRELYEAERVRIDAIPKYGVVDARTFYSLRPCRSLHAATVDAQTMWYIAQNLTGRLRRAA